MDYTEMSKQALIEEIKKLRERLTYLEQVQNLQLGDSGNDVSEPCQLIINTLPQLIAYTDKDLRYRFVNQAYQRKFGLEPADILGKTLPEVIGEEAFQKAQPHVERALQGERVRYHEHYEYQKGGSRYIDGVLIPDVDPEGEVRGYYAVLTDITPYMEMQHTIQERKQRFQKSFDTELVAMAISRREDGTILEVNPGFLKASGYPRSEVVGRTSREIGFLSEEERKDILERIAEKGRLHNQEIEYHTQRGEIRTILYSVGPITLHGEACLQWVMIDITDRVRVEKKLQKSEERFQEVIQQSPIGMAVVDSQGELIDCNQAMEGIVGYTRDEMVTLNYEDFTHPEDLEKERRLIEALWTRDRDQYQLIKRYIHKDGHLVWVEVVASVIRDQDGRLSLGFAFVQDITDRVRSQKELAESEQKYRLLAEHTTDIIYRLDLEQDRYTYVSPSVETVLGYTPEEVRALSPDQVMTPESYQLQNEIMEQDLLAGKKDSELLELEAIHKEGHIVPVEVNASFVFDETQKPVEILGVVRDITERKQAQEKLEENEERYRTLYNNTPVMLHSIDRQGRLLEVSDYWLAKMGYERNEVIGRKSTEFLTEESRRFALEEALPNYFQTGVAWDVPYQFVRKNGEIIEVLLSAIAERDPDGEIVRSLAVLIDITERKQAEAEIEQREAILGAVRFAAETFLKPSSWSERVSRVLEELGLAADVSRVYIFKNEYLEDGTVVTKHRYEWAAPGITSQLGNPDLAEVPLRASGFERWEEALSQGDLIHGDVQTFPPQERALLAAQEILSIVVVPIFVEDEWWGFIGFDECEQEKDWPAVEIEALKVAADTLGAAIHQNRVEEALRESEHRYELATEAGQVGVWDWNLDTNELYIDPRLKALLGYEDDEIQNHMDDWEQHIHPDDFDRVMEEVTAYLDGERPSFEITHRMVHKNGRERWFLARGRVIQDGEGRPSRMVGADTDITDRKLAEEALRESEEQFDLFMEYIPAAVSIIDTEGRLVYSNQRFANISGVPEEILVGVAAEGEISPEIQQKYQEEHQRILSGEIIVSEDVTRRDGEKRFWRTYKFPIYRHEEVAYVGSVVLDITERKRVEEALRESEEQFDLFMEYIPAAVFIKDQEGRVVYGNQRFAEISNAPLEDLIGTTTEDVTPPALHEQYQEENQRVLAGEMVISESMIPNGEYPSYWLTYKFPIHRNGKPALVGAVSLDITERKRAEKAFQEAEHRYYSLFEQSHDAVFLLDLEGEHLEANQRAAEMLGYTRREIQQLSFRDLSANVTASQRILKRVRNGERIPIYERIFRKKDGTEFPVEVNLELVRDVAGRPKHLQSIVRDITKRKVTEEALRQSEARYRSIVENQTIFVCRFTPDEILTYVNEPYCEKFGMSRKELIGNSFMSAIPEEDRPFVRSQVQNLTPENPLASYEHRVITGAGRVEWQYWTSKALFDQKGELLEFQSVGVDITEQKQAKQKLRHRISQLELLNDVGAKIAGLQDPERVLETLVELVHNYFGYYHVAILTLDEEQEEMVLRASQGGLNEFITPSYRQDLQHGLIGWAARNQEIIVANDVQKNPHYISFSEEPLPIRSELSVPICQGETLIGVLDIQSEVRDAFDESDILVMETLSDQIAVAVESARLYEAQRESSEKLRELALYEQKAREEERKLITREIHDEIGQFLTVLKLNLESFSPGDEEQLAEAQELLDQLIKRVKNLALILRPSLLDDLGLIHAVQWLVDHYQKQSGLQINFQHLGLENTRFPLDLEIAAYRIIQEALTNVVRHAEAEHATVGLLRDQDYLRVQVRDSGAGFDLEQKEQDQQTFGLTSMQERAALLEGQLIVDTSPGEGTQVLAILPLEKNHEKEQK